MDIEQRMKKPLPFYMTHPGYFGPGKENTVLRDLEYLQQTYPLEVRKYQRRVAEILDKMDYEGSMIYDEYPDRYSLLLQFLVGNNLVLTHFLFAFLFRPSKTAEERIGKTARHCQQNDGDAPA